MTKQATVDQIRIIRAYAVLMRNTALAKLCAEAEFDDLTPEVTAARRKLGQMIERAHEANARAKVQLRIELNIDPSLPAEARDIIAEQFHRIFPTGEIVRRMEKPHADQVHRRSARRAPKRSRKVR